LEVIARRLTALSVRGLFYLGLFLLVIVGQAALTTLLRQQGMDNGPALAVAGAGVFGAVIVALIGYNALAAFYCAAQRR
jgi:hypothetical protein